MELIKFYEFIYDRQQIWHRRFIQKLGPPWTSDPVLKTFKFCNVYRENDKCTQYLIENVINNQTLILSEIIFNIILFRRFNVYGLFDGIFEVITKPEEFKAKYWEAHLDNCKERYRLFNDAYNLSQAPFNKSYRQKDKHVQILMSMEHIGNSISNLTMELYESESLKEAFEIITKIKLVGPFLGYQILQDIMYIKNFLKHDVNSFVSVGPGAAGAIEILKEDFKPLGFIKTKEDACRFLFESQAFYFNKLFFKSGKSWMEIYYKSAYYKSENLSIGNIQSCMCEFRKYQNLILKHRPRKRYYKGAKNGL